MLRVHRTVDSLVQTTVATRPEPLIELSVAFAILVPLTAADQPQAPPEIRQALRTLDRHVDASINRARRKTAAGNLTQM